MKDFLNKEQVTELEELEWDVRPKGCYLKLYRDDYRESEWEDICFVIGANTESNSVTVLICGIVEKK